MVAAHHAQLPARQLRQQRVAQGGEGAGFGGRKGAACFCPNGAASISPGLRGTSYPGFIGKKRPNPNGVAANRAAGEDATPLGLGKHSGTLTQGSLADSATLGWRTQSRWD